MPENHISFLLNFFYSYSRKLIDDKIISNINTQNISIDFLSKSKRGDISSNFFLLVQKKIILKEFNLKSDLSKKLLNIDIISKVDISNNGFINIFLEKKYLQKKITSILVEKENFGKINLGKNKKINIEYVSANPTGPIHIAHIRGAVLGDVLSNILNKTGYKVTKEYYVNDSGNQTDILGKSLYKRYCQLLNVDVSIEEGEYPGEYLIQIAKEIIEKYNDKFLETNDSKVDVFFRNYAVNYLINHIKKDLDLLNINFDIFTYESEIVKKNLIKDLFSILDKKNLLYEGILEKPIGDDNSDWEPREQLIFKASKIFDDKDRALKKANGEWTYFANDAAYHYDKFLRNYHSIINIWGADHIGYISRMKSIVKAISNKDNYLEVLICQIVRLIQNNEILKMSKREGNFITLKRVFNLVGKDPLRYYMISTKSETAMDFNIDKVTEKNKDNPVFYCQYAYVRAISVLNKAKELNIHISENDNDLNIEKYITNDEWEIILKLISFPYIIIQISNLREPHRLCNYIEHISSIFHSLWNKGKDDESLRFIDEKNIPKTKSKLIWLTTFKIVLNNSFELIGIDSPDKM